jgi:hypothetical protein
MNHIATGRALSVGGELLPPHHGRHQRRWRWRWSQWRWLRGQFPVPTGCRNRDFCPPNFVFDGGGAAEHFVDGDCSFRVFASEGFYSRKGDAKGWTRGPTPPGGTARGTRTTNWCGYLLALLHLCFGLCLRDSKIGTSGFVLSNSENISCVTSLKHKNSRKQELAL